MVVVSLVDGLLGSSETVGMDDIAADVVGVLVSFSVCKEIDLTSDDKAT